MRIKDKKRTIGIGIIVWLLFFGWWFNGYLYLNWQFELFSWRSWRFLLNEFRSGWKLTTKGDWIFLFSFLISGPIYFALWYGANQIYWFRCVRCLGRNCKKPFKNLKKQEKTVTISTTKEPATQLSLQRPAKLSPTSNFVRPSSGIAQVSQAPFEMTTPQPAWMSPTTETTPAEKNYPPDQPFYHADSSFDEVAETPLSEVQLPQIESVNEDISSVMQSKGFKVFTDLPFGEVKLNWVGVSQNQLLVGIYDDETGDWLADEEAFNEEDPLWFSETDHRVSPVFTLKQIQKQLNAMELGVKVQPVLIERRGNLINAEDMMKTWNDLGVVVCRTDVGGPVELSTFSEACSQSQQAPSEDILSKVRSIFKIEETNNG